jgi:cytochrome c553
LCFYDVVRTAATRWQIGIGALALAGALLAALTYAAPTDELRAALRLKPDYENGAALYETCAECHRKDGAGAADGGVPVIAAQHYEVVVKQLVDFRGAKRIDLRMNAFLARHNVERLQHVVDLAEFISNLPPQGTDDVGAGRFTGIGAQAYRRACADCHGAEAEGDDKLRQPRLAGQHYRYLIGQIEMMTGGTRPNVSQDHPKLLETLTDAEVIGVADYLARLRPVPGSRP